MKRYFKTAPPLNSIFASEMLEQQVRQNPFPDMFDELSSRPNPEYFEFNNALILHLKELLLLREKVGILEEQLRRSDAAHSDLTYQMSAVKGHADKLRNQLVQLDNMVPPSRGTPEEEKAYEERNNSLTFLLKRDVRNFIKDFFHEEPRVPLNRDGDDDE